MNDKYKNLDSLIDHIGSKAINKLSKKFPDKYSDTDKASIHKLLSESVYEHKDQLLVLVKQDDIELIMRIKELEGTASDLKQGGIFGRIVLFLRGAQRPVWGYFVIYMDFMVFSGRWDIYGLVNTVNSHSTEMNMESVFWIINFLVLGFLFGERAMKNVLPLFNRVEKNNSTNSI